MGFDPIAIALCDGGETIVDLDKLGVTLYVMYLLGSGGGQMSLETNLQSFWDGIQGKKTFCFALDTKQNGTQSFIPVIKADETKLTSGKHRVSHLQGIVVMDGVLVSVEMWASHVNSTAEIGDTCVKVATYPLTATEVTS